jgi:hypothetical protein
LLLSHWLRHIRYIDIDVHHGDGVEEAFAYEQGVFSLSFHRHGPGFFPGTGDLPDICEGSADADDACACCKLMLSVDGCLMRYIVLMRIQHVARSMFLTARGSATHHSCICSKAFSLPLLKHSGRLRFFVSSPASPYFFVAASVPRPLCCNWELTRFLVTGEQVGIGFINVNLQPLHPFINCFCAAWVAATCPRRVFPA